MARTGDRYPDRKPVAPCAGWLAHNTQACDCYYDDRKREADRLGPLDWFADYGMPVVVVVLIIVTACGLTWLLCE